MDCEPSTAVNDAIVHVASRSSERNHDKVPRKIHNAEREKQKPDKAPRKTLKAEREKQKRDSMNVLFSELAKVLEPSHQNYGKTCLLRETIRLVGELIKQIDNLRNENAALSSESHYMTVEKDELKDEKRALEVQIEKLQAEIDETVRSQTSNIDHCQPQPREYSARASIDDYASSNAPILIVPLQNDLRMYSVAEKVEALHNLPSNVSRPRPRYPSPSDSWPSCVLNEQSSATESFSQVRN